MASMICGPFEMAREQVHRVQEAWMGPPRVSIGISQTERKEEVLAMDVKMSLVTSLKEKLKSV